MKSMCCNCKYFDPVQPPYCHYNLCYVDPVEICDYWATNQPCAADSRRGYEERERE